jgi:hypothetical protein
VRVVSDLFSESEVSYRLVDRAIGELRPTDAPSPRIGVVESDVRDCMREELFGLIAHLHFNDISSRQLEYAAGRIAEMRRWMDALEHEAVDLPR